ncbi:hypothetical protein MY04_0145 [Flammeovirga sp. MY04]|uniref:hypothetical protein n=1 Tax=Flammeovirga sp. MY04 TaxID=1191459 RepID=UPI0008062679|nr:hypothetical protein [Flammeovirga sp. MY04]ANQ47527.1 hypothetical protein MY04_0145 [Flammeovirga sp. MY04]
MIKNTINLLWLLLLFSLSTNAQSKRYWSNSFNTDANLLSGAVVGGGSGIAAIFYNPAQIADIDYQKFAISANIFSLYIYRYNNALGGGDGYNDWNFKVQPRFVAFLLRPKKWESTSIELASFTRDKVSTELRSRNAQELDIIKSRTGNEIYLADYYYRMNYEDYWLSIGIAKKFDDKFSIGISGYHSYVSFKYDYEIDTRAFSAEPVTSDDSFYISQYKNVQSLSGYSSRLLFKLGLKYQWRDWQFGMAVQTPSINYLGESKVYREVSMQNIHNQDGDLLPNMLVSEYQEELPTAHKDPFSVAFGATYKHKNSSFYFTGEYFGKVNRYKKIEDQEPGPYVTNNIIGIRTDNWLNYYAQNNEITNVAVGYRVKLEDNIEIMSGFRTDFVYDDYDGGFDNRYPSEITSFSIDQYHATVGGQFTILKTDIIAGLQYSFAIDNNLKQVANFSDPVEIIPEQRLVLQGVRNNNMGIYEHTLSLFLGFTYNIGRPN